MINEIIMKSPTCRGGKPSCHANVMYSIELSFYTNLADKVRLVLNKEERIVEAYVTYGDEERLVRKSCIEDMPTFKDEIEEATYYRNAFNEAHTESTYRVLIKEKHHTLSKKTTYTAIVQAKKKNNWCEVLTFKDNDEWYVKAKVKQFLDIITIKGELA